VLAVAGDQVLTGDPGDLGLLSGECGMLTMIVTEICKQSA